MGGWPGRYESAIRKSLLIEMATADSNNSWKHRPYEPDLCLVSQGLIDLFDTMNVPPQAIAGNDLSVEGTEPDGAEVTLDGSASTDPDNDVLSYKWTGPFGEVSGQIIKVTLEIGTHCITLTVADPSGHIDRDMLKVTVGEMTDVDYVEFAELPETYSLSQNYPNPFNPRTRIEFTLPHRAFVTIDVFNMLGVRVKRLVNESLSAGNKAITWDGKDDAGVSVSSGIYLYRISTNDFVESKKMILMK